MLNCVFEIYIYHNKKIKLSKIKTFVEISKLHKNTINI